MTSMCEEHGPAYPIQNVAFFLPSSPTILFKRSVQWPGPTALSRLRLLPSSPPIPFPAPSGPNPSLPPSLKPRRRQPLIEPPIRGFPIPIRMGDGADGDAASVSGRRCQKHPSQPPFTGFCSACLLDRLHATNLVLASPQLPPSLARLDLQEDNEEPEPTATRPRRTTLLLLFQLEDHEEQKQSNAAPSSSTNQDPLPHLQRKRSLRQSCSEWISCCDTSSAAAAAANHSSFLPSRQSLDASCSTAAPAPAPCNGFAVVERRTASLRVWAIRGFRSKPADHLLNRSFSESSRSRYAHHNPTAIAMSSSSSQSQDIRRNGSLSVSSTGIGSSEISLPDDSLANHCRPRLKNRLHWLRRSRSVHYSSPTSQLHAGLTPFRSRSSSSRSTTDKKAQQPSRRLNLNLFAAGFFGSQRHQG